MAGLVIPCAQGREEAFAVAARELLSVKGAAWDGFRGEVVLGAAKAGPRLLNASDARGQIDVLESDYVHVSGNRVGCGTRSFSRPVAGARLVAFAVQPDARILLVMAGTTAAGQGIVMGDFGGGRLVSEVHQLYPVQRTLEGARQLDDFTYATDGPRMVGSADGPLDYGGAFEAYLWGVRLVGRQANGSPIDESSGETRKGHLGLEAGDGGTDRFVHMSMLGAQLHVDAAMADVWLGDAFARGRDGSVDLRDARGVVPGAHGERHLDNDTVRLEHWWGWLRASPVGSDGYAAVALSSERANVFINGKPWPIAAAPASVDMTAASAWLTALLALVSVAYAASRLGAMSLLSRRTRREAWTPYVVRTLLDGRRRRVYETILANPGIQPYALWQRTGGGFGSFLRGLERLEKIGYVRSVKAGRFRHFFGIHENPSPTMFVSATRTGREAIAVLEIYGPLSAGQLAARLRISPSMAFVRLQKLRAAGAVTRHRVGAVFHYSLSEKRSAAGPSHEPGPATAPLEA